MVKKLFVLRIGDYRPDLCQFTIPTIKAYAEKIGAEYVEINNRSIKAWPLTCEKLQVFNLGHDSDWNILVDADIMIHPKMPDVTQYLPHNAVASAFAFDADSMFVSDKFFERDGRNIGVVANFVVTPKLVHDVWTPLFFNGDSHLSLNEAKKRSKREFILDEYTLSRNLALYGLKHTGILPMPALTEMIVHFGNEEKTDEERQATVQEAAALSVLWKEKFGDSK